MTPSKGGAKGLSRRPGFNKRPKMKYAGQAKHVKTFRQTVLQLDKVFALCYIEHRLYCLMRGCRSDKWAASICLGFVSAERAQ